MHPSYSLWKSTKFLYQVSMLPMPPMCCMHPHNTNTTSVLEIADIDFSRVELEWRRLTSNVPEFWKLQNDGREFQVGEMAAARGLSAKHPVILIPGVISTVRRQMYRIIPSTLNVVLEGSRILVHIT